MLPSFIPLSLARYHVLTHIVISTGKTLFFLSLMPIAYTMSSIDPIKSFNVLAMCSLMSSHHISKSPELCISHYACSKYHFVCIFFLYIASFTSLFHHHVSPLPSPSLTFLHTQSHAPKHHPHNVPTIWHTNVNQLHFHHLCMDCPHIL